MDDEIKVGIKLAMKKAPMKVAMKVVPMKKPSMNVASVMKVKKKPASSSPRN